MATIVLTGGGSAGHCIPHLAVLPYLKNTFNNIYYIGSKDGIEKNIIETAKIPYYEIPCAKLERRICAKNIKMPFTVLSGIKEAGKILDKLKPDVIFSKGGYVSLPTVIAAKKRNIPVITHESDYTVGLANKIISRYCQKVLTSFPETASQIKNGEYVGSPIRNSIFSATRNDGLAFFGFGGKKPIILFIGGSLGARTVNETVFKAVPQLIKKYDIIHICGKGNVNTELKKKGYYQAEYINKMENAFACADVCVSRAGSNALFELMALKKPTLLIPLPKGVSRGDQVLNAAYFEKNGMAEVLQQSSLTEKSIICAVNSVYNNRQTLISNMSAAPVTDKSRQISRILADCVKNV